MRRACVLLVVIGLGACEARPPEPVPGVVRPSRIASPAPAAPRLAPAPARADLVVHGIGTGDHRRSFALISVGSAPPALLEIGDTLGEVRLLQVGEDFVVMEEQGLARKVLVGGRVKPVGPVAAAPKVAPVLGATTGSDDLRSNRAFQKFLFTRDAAPLQ